MIGSRARRRRSR